jgi:hypothetical protein
LTSKGNGSIDVSSANLQGGVYAYSLIVDEKILETKKMVKGR